MQESGPVGRAAATIREKLEKTDLRVREYEL